MTSAEALIASLYRELDVIFCDKIRRSSEYYALADKTLTEKGRLFYDIAAITLREAAIAHRLIRVRGLSSGTLRRASVQLPGVDIAIPGVVCDHEGDANADYE